MRGFVDLHTHILPGVDDGAKDMPEAVSLIRMAYENGTRAVVLTPHYRGAYKRTSQQWIQNEFSSLCQLVKEQLPDMELYLGREVYFDSEVPELLHSGAAQPINHSGYVLLEFSPGSPRSRVIKGVSETVLCGFTPIIAHAERYRIFREDTTLLDEVLDLGALIQLNADSILGKQGPWIKKYCHSLLKRQAAHIIASDAHNAEHRPPLLRECFLQIHKKYGKEYAAKLFSDNALAVIENRTV